MKAEQNEMNETAHLQDMETAAHVTPTQISHQIIKTYNAQQNSEMARAAVDDAVQLRKKAENALEKIHQLQTKILKKYQQAKFDQKKPNQQNYLVKRPNQTLFYNRVIDPKGKCCNHPGKYSPIKPALFPTNSGVFPPAVAA